MRPHRGHAEQRRMDKLNRPTPGVPFIWIDQNMLMSDGWRALSHAASMCLWRTLIEHTAHGGQENGNLAVTYDDFERYGVRRKSIKGALQELVALGWIDVISSGRAGQGIGRAPGRYALTWLPTVDGAAGTNRWKTIQTKADALKAIEIVGKARAARKVVRAYKSDRTAVPLARTG